MSYEAIINAVDTINAAVAGIRKTYKFEPTAGIVTPCIQATLADDSFQQVASAERATYRIRMRMLLRLTEEEAGQEHVLKDRVRVAYHTCIMLNGALSNGAAYLDGSRGAYMIIANQAYRVVEFILIVHEIEAITYRDIKYLAGLVSGVAQVSGAITVTGA